MPYGLEQLKDARERGFLVLVEGESDCWPLWQHGYPALGLPGAAAAKALEAAHLDGIERLYVHREPDRGGEMFVQGVTRRLAQLRWRDTAFCMTLPDGVKDPSDLHRQVHQRDPLAFRAAFDAALEQAAPLAPAPCVDPSDPTDPADLPGEVSATDQADGGAVAGRAPGGESRKRTQFNELVDLAADAEVFHAPNDRAYATIAVGTHRETWTIKGKHFKLWLAKQYYEATTTDEEPGRAPSSEAIQAALNVLEARALFDGPEWSVYTRVAPGENAVYLDLVNERWEAVEITPEGWRVIAEPLVKFQRAPGMRPLPYPVPGGSVAELRPFLNLTGDDDWVLVIGWLVGALRPSGPYPLLALHGEQGSAKSTSAQVLRALLDPNQAPLRAEPRDGRDLMIAAQKGWCLTYDNLSHLSPWLSDAFCRLATGGGFSTRELYTDAEEVIFEAQRPVILTGIDELTTRGDLLDRALVTLLPAIPEGHRRAEADFWTAFEAARPRILGALLDAVSAALRHVPTTHLDGAPRMADFATWVTAAEPGLGWPPGTFLAVYAANRAASNELALEASSVVPYVRALATAKEGTGHTGTASDLLALLNERVDEAIRKQREWPKNGRVFSGLLRRLAPNLRATGIHVEFVQTAGRGSRKFITLCTSGSMAGTDDGGKCDASDACDAPASNGTASGKAEPLVVGQTASQRRLFASHAASQNWDGAPARPEKESPCVAGVARVANIPSVPPPSGDGSVGGIGGREQEQDERPALEEGIL